jgi:hypothetical protein
VSESKTQAALVRIIKDLFVTTSPRALLLGFGLEAASPSAGREIAELENCS